jgi:hypothetical protein
LSDRSQIISLFEDHKQARRGISSVFLSGIFHGLGTGLLWFGLLHVPRIREPIITERYSVRHLDLHSSEVGANSNPRDRYYPKADGDAKKDSKDPDLNQPDPALPDLPDAIEAKQTLVQPEFHTHAALSEEAPIPTVVVWTPEVAPAKHIITPSPDKPTSTDAKASLDAPNEELDLGDHAMNAAVDLPKMPTPPAGTTTPLVAQADSSLHLAPATTSDSPDRPTPTALLSISDLRMTDGTIVVPPVNQTHSVPEKGALVPDATAGARAGSNAPGSDDGSNKQGTEGDKPLTVAGSETTQHITLPKDGKFGVIVVGTSLGDEYPETLQIWSDRVAYTAYLHVGLTKNWILQYAQLRSTEAAANGNVARLEAPWPYDILRPNLVASDLNADALMVHGILNEAGQLESLAVAFPQQFAQAAFVLQALQKWQFRPALQQGKPTAVEVLLIIPDELD